MNRLAIVADDLTGASDSGVQFARKGLKTVVATDRLRAIDQKQIEILVIDTDSRAVPVNQAYTRVKDAIQELNQLGIANIYKKVDSTLRGNLGIEIDAILDQCEFDFSVIAPAYPEMNRLTIHGVHFLNNMELHMTEIGRDPKCPVNDSNIVSLLGQQSKRKAGRIDIETIRAGKKAILQQALQLYKDGIQLVVADSETKQDMINLVDALAGIEKKILWVGSAGLAQYIPQLHQMPVRRQEKLGIGPSTQPLLLVAGSISTITLQQIEAFKQVPSVVAVQLNALACIQDQAAYEQELNRCTEKIRRVITEKKDVAFYATSTPEQVEETVQYCLQHGVERYDIANRIALALGKVAAQVLATETLQGVILTGGDTAVSVCRQAGIEGLLLKDEIEPGIPLSKTIGGVEPLWAVTKAGAFGSKETFIHALEILKGENK